MIIKENGILVGEEKEQTTMGQPRIYKEKKAFSNYPSHEKIIPSRIVEAEILQTKINRVLIFTGLLLQNANVNKEIVGDKTDLENYKDQLACIIEMLEAQS
jgi:hypothetical protein